MILALDHPFDNNRTRQRERRARLVTHWVDNEGGIRKKVGTRKASLIYTPISSSLTLVSLIASNFIKYHKVSRSIRLTKSHKSHGLMRLSISRLSSHPGIKGIFKYHLVSWVGEYVSTYTRVC
ncbi:hypothetical protein M413DRAFT_124486 [Hebeloma cylindrosporum]|uniref:Uncharacterized protein n=1 Tax=Hebeloma cylindrosporum TaxID=76867 RepID=A0A0C2XYX4_HEBCY|nr:hypothetical protein M413DRAFT_124486 [Hebeloma cylindrosporum h7]